MPGAESRRDGDFASWSRSKKRAQQHFRDRRAHVGPHHGRLCPHITVRFVLERDINDAANDVREKVASAMGRVPPELLTPVITKVDPDSDPVMTIVVSVRCDEPQDADRDRRQAGEARDRNGRTASVRSSLAVDGAREVHHRRRHREAELLTACRFSRSATPSVGENVEIPGGTRRAGEVGAAARTLGRIDATDQFNNIVIATNNGTPIRVSGHRLCRGRVRAPQERAPG